jgi:RND superfamily putative drug exporter
MTGTRTITASEAGVGESGDAQRLIDSAHLEDPAVESILVTSDDPGTTAANAAALARSVSRVDNVGKVTTATENPDLSADGGRAELIQVTMRGDPGKAEDHISALEGRVQTFAGNHPDSKVEQAGDASLSNAMDQIVEDDLSSAETTSLPVILVILLLAFGALVAASVPLLLGVTATAGAIGAAGLVSQIVPADDSTASVVVLIGLAVGVDYSLFYIRREREERRAGKGTEAALDATAATVGRAVVVAGMTVMVALGGLILTGLAVFESMALATMVVVLLAVVGSVTALPAMLELLGTKVDRGRIPFVARLRARRASSGRPGMWERVVTAIARRPVASLIAAVAVLGALAVPAFGMHLGDSSTQDLPKDEPTVQALNHIDSLFPGAPSDVQLVVAGDHLNSAASQRKLEEVGRRAARITGGAGSSTVTTARDGSAASIAVPMPDVSRDASTDIVGELRADLGEVDGNEVLVTGEAAESADFTTALNDAMPIVLAGVLGLAFLLLLAAFRSPWLAASVVGLNLLSVGAAYGVLVAVFQHGWGAETLGVIETGSVGSWIPLFSFVILFGLSMDYTVIVLERIREGRQNGLSAREAAARGVGATAGAVTSAAAVMVAVFSLFALQRMPEMQQLGVGLAAAVLIDATIVRAVALPAVVALLGDRRWRVAPSRAARRRRYEQRRERGEIIASRPDQMINPAP